MGQVESARETAKNGLDLGLVRVLYPLVGILEEVRRGGGLSRKPSWARSKTCAMHAS